jgi:hypothetical protein
MRWSPSSPRSWWPHRSTSTCSPIAAVVAAPLDLDVLAALVAIVLVAIALVAIALVAAVVAELEPPHARHRRPSSTRRPGGGRRARRGAGGLGRGERQWWCAGAAPLVAVVRPGGGYAGR